MSMKNILKMIVCIFLLLSTILTPYFLTEIISGTIIKMYIYLIVPFLMATIYCYQKLNNILNWELVLKLPIVLCLAFIQLSVDIMIIFHFVEKNISHVNVMLLLCGLMFIIFRFIFYLLMAYIWYPAFFEEKIRRKLPLSNTPMKQKPVYQLKYKNIIICFLLFVSTLLFALPMSSIIFLGLPYIYICFVAPYYIGKFLFQSSFQNVKNVGLIYKIPIIFILAVLLMVTEMIIGMSSNMINDITQIEILNFFHSLVELELNFWVSIILVRIVFYSLMIYIWLPHRMKNIEVTNC